MSVPPDQLSFLDRLGMLPSRIDQRLQPFGGAANLGAALLANSGYSTTPRTFGSVLGASALQGQQMAAQRQKLQQDQEEAALMKRYREAQITAMQAKPATDNPNSVKEYEYAKQNGFKGTFQDWITAGGQSSRPSSVQEWEFYNTLPQEMQQRYLEMKRNPNFFVQDVNGGKSVIHPTVGGGTSVNPISTKETEADAAELLARFKAYGSAMGEGAGKIATGINTKGSEAVAGGNILDLADPLIDAATGSSVGAGRDKLAAVFGVAPKGARAISKLQVLQAALMMNQPRMEGPQGEKDVELYQKAAGQIGDPTVPAETKKAAVQSIRALQEKYKQRANIVPIPEPAASPTKKRVRVDAQGNVIGD